MAWLTDEELEQAWVEDHLGELELADTQRALEAEADERDAAVQPVCYLGHEWCWDQHWSERRADEVDWEQERS